MNVLDSVMNRAQCTRTVCVTIRVLHESVNAVESILIYDSLRAKRVSLIVGGRWMPGDPKGSQGMPRDAKGSQGIPG